MPQLPVPSKVSSLLERPNPATIATVRPDGQPVTVATWYLWEDGRILVNMDAGRKRLQYLRDDPRVSITVLDADSWYTHVSLQGRVADLHDDPELTDIDRLAQHYTGERYATRDRARVSAWVEIERWHGWGIGDSDEADE